MAAAPPFSSSHDLRAPLRALHGFARTLAARDGHALSAEGTRHLDTIRRNAVVISGNAVKFAGT